MVAEQGRLAKLSLEHRVSRMEWLLRLLGALSGLSLVGILGFAFWLGGLSSKLSNSADTASRIYGALAENKDSLLVRTGVIEHRLDSLEKRLESVEKKLDSLEKKFETRLDSVESKLDKLLELHSRR